MKLSPAAPPHVLLFVHNCLRRACRPGIHAAVVLLFIGSSMLGNALESKPAPVHVVRPGVTNAASSPLHRQLIRPMKTRPNAKPLRTGSGITYTCDPGVAAATCNYLNTIVANAYNSTFNNANASIYIQYGTTGLGQSTTGFFNSVTYTQYVAALTANTQKSASQVSALSALSTYDSPSYGSGSVVITSALGMALGFTGMVGTTVGGSPCTVPSAGCYNGIITVVSDPASEGIALYYDNLGGTEPSNGYDFYGVVEHETDEVLGTASCIDTQSSPLVDDCNYLGTGTPSAVDLYRYQAPGTLVLDSSLSATPGAYFSYDGGVTNDADGLAGAPLYYNTLNNGDDYADFVSGTPDCGTNIAVQDATGCPGEDKGLSILNDGGAEINLLATVGYQVPNNSYVVTTTLDDSAGVAGNCPGGNSPASTNCSLRDALAAAESGGAGKITFDPTVFATAQTITLTNAALNIPADTSITGPTSGSGAALTNLVTVSGGAGGDFSTTASGVAISNLAIVAGRAGSGGGLLNSGGGVTITNCTFANNAGTSHGGAIYNTGTLTVTGSTFSDNASPLGGGIASQSGAVTISNSTLTGSTTGGAIYAASSTVNVNSSTISGNNTAGSNAGGIDNEGGTVHLANTVVSGNTLGGGEADTYGGYTDQGGNQVSGGFTATALGSNGGPTQTMTPQPGDAAICGGTLANATAAGITLDQRGFVFDPHCPTGTVDSGAVQSDYALEFGNVPHSTIAGQALTPAPTTTLLESGMLATASTAAVTLSDVTSALSGATTQNLSSGVASFPGVSFTAVAANSQLLATMALNSSLNLVATAGTTTTVSPAPAALASPAPGSTLAGPAATFSWSPASGATAYSLWIGTGGAGSNNLYTSGAQVVTSLRPSDLPTNGATVYARLFTIFNGVANFNDYTFTASTRAALTAPSSPGPLTGPSATFTWSAATGAVGYSLWLGTGGVGSSNLYDSRVTTALTAAISGLPTNGSTIYARINTLYPGGISVSSDSTFTAATEPMAMLTTPTPTSTLSGARVNFTWTAGTGATGYALWIGSSGPGSGNLYQSHATTALTAIATGLPTNGAPVYVRLYTFYNNVAKYTDYTYTAAP